MRAFRLHTVVPIAEYLAYKDPHIASDEHHNEDKLANVFVYLDISRHIINEGVKFYNLDHIKDDELMPVVSFVGPTGAGKSTLMRLCCKDGTARPLSASSNSESTSSDIHGYIGTFPTQQHPSTALLLDSEGSAGTAPKSWTSTLQHLGADKLKDFFDKRKPYINTSYPRLLYMFSSVFCFVSTMAPKQQQTLIQDLVLYANLAAAATVNSLSIPVLILIFNKTASAEGEWDIAKASAPLQLPEITRLFREVYAVHIPDRDNEGKLYATQITALKDLIAKSIDKQTLFTKHAVTQMFSYALPEFSKDPETVFNFMDIAMRNTPLPSNFTTYLIEYFQHIYRVNCKFWTKDAFNPHEAFEIAVNELSKRLQDAFYHHIVRNNIPISSQIPDDLKMRVTEVETAILPFVPCQSQYTFPDLPAPVRCENSAGSHILHKSSLTYKVQVLGDGLFAKMFSRKKLASFCCQWDGPVDVPPQYSAPGWLLRSVAQLNAKPLVTSTFLQEHRQLLRDQQAIVALLERTSNRVCAACLLSAPTELLRCKHKLCISCCKEIQQDGTIECPVCDAKVPWTHEDIPDYAGVRVLTVDGGVRGIISATILAKIEKRIGVPLHYLFDFIVGTSAGAINAICFGSLKLPGDRVQQLFKVLSSNTALEPVPFWHLFSEPYHQEPMHKALKEVIPPEYLVGYSQFPRIAAVGCELRGAQHRQTLFSSYYATNSEIRATLLEVAEASVGAGIFFPVLQTNFGRFVDGGCVCQNPCSVGYKEAKLMWPGKSIDMLISIGSGDYSAIRPTSVRSNRQRAMVRVTEITPKWFDLKETPSTTDFIRLSVPLPVKFEVAESDTDVINTVAETERHLNHYKENFDKTCNTILAKLFYPVNPLSDKPSFDAPASLAIKDKCTIIIKSRIKERIAQLSSGLQLSDVFKLKMFFDGHSSPFMRYSFVESDNGARIDFIEMPVKGNIELNVFCHLQCDGKISENGILISGCPLIIKRKN